MKKLFIMAVIALAIFTSCASLVANSTGMTQEDSAYRIIPKTPGENRALAIFYGPEYLKEKENKRAEIEMREPNYEMIPEYGYISIKIQGWTAETANPEYWLFIVQDGNQNEIYRDYGLPSIPNGHIGYLGNAHYTSTWSNFHNILLMDEPIYPLYLRVISPDKTNIDITIIKK
ncbi:MAG: hypothetical protein LBC17_02130 [Lactobacillaceae bacterium]|jgi:hypothetical protein|nr:hypothetical protein [Lactobacillaceae bacterium]